ncbi:hypothetical protein D1872_226330 [compost metagenome]
MAEQHVDQLRQFVQPGRPQQAAQPGYALVAVAGEDRPGTRLRTVHHAAKLQQRKRPAPKAQPFLHIQRPPFGGQRHGSEQQQHERGSRDKQERGKPQVRAALDETLRPGQPGRPQRIEQLVIQLLQFRPSDGQIQKLRHHQHLHAQDARQSHRFLSQGRGNARTDQEHLDTVEQQGFQAAVQRWRASAGPPFPACPHDAADLQPGPPAPHKLPGAFQILFADSREEGCLFTARSSPAQQEPGHPEPE